MAYAPTLDDCAASLERSRQELDHLERTVELYRELFGSELVSKITSIVEQFPLPRSWLEAAVAQLVLCLASSIDAQRELTADAAAVEWIQRIAEETEHVDAARAALREIFRIDHIAFTTAATLIAQWLDLALSTLDGSLGERYLDVLRTELATLGFDVDGEELAVIAAPERKFRAREPSIGSS